MNKIKSYFGLEYVKIIILISFQFFVSVRTGLLKPKIENGKKGNQDKQKQTKLTGKVVEDCESHGGTRSVEFLHGFLRSHTSEVY